MAKVKQPKKELTLEQKTKLFLAPCKNKQELKQWINYFLALDLPDFTVSRHATTNPLEVVWEIYRICVLKVNPENIQELLYVASRGSGKTLGAAIAEFMIIIHDQRDIAHVGAIMAQAKRAYEYIQTFCVSPNVKPIIDPKDTPEADKILQKSTMERSVFMVKGEKCTMEVLPTTMKALNGVHCSLVSCVDATSEIDVKIGGVQTQLTASFLHQQSSDLKIEVLSYNHQTSLFEYKPLLSSAYMGKKKRIKIYLDNGAELICTPDHLIWSPKANAYVRADSMLEGEDILSSD